MEYVLNFEKFDKPKTIVNVSDWIFESFECAKLKHADVNQFSADGASNAIGSVSEYESLSRTARGNDVQFDVCYAHQNQRSGVRVNLIHVDQHSQLIHSKLIPKLTFITLKVLLPPFQHRP